MAAAHGGGVFVAHVELGSALPVFETPGNVYLFHVEGKYDGADLSSGIIAHHDTYVVGAGQQVQLFLQPYAFVSELRNGFWLWVSSYWMEKFSCVFYMFIEGDGSYFQVHCVGP